MFRIRFKNRKGQSRPLRSAETKIEKRLLALRKNLKSNENWSETREYDDYTDVGGIIILKRKEWILSIGIRSYWLLREGLLFKTLPEIADYVGLNYGN